MNNIERMSSCRKKKEYRSCHFLRQVYVLLILFLFTSFPGYSQKDAGKITLKRENVTLEIIINEIEKQSGYNFLYNENFVNLSPKASVDVKEISLNEVLSQILSRHDLDYRIEGKHVIITAKKNNPSSMEAVQQDPVIISGTVKDEHGESVVGATVGIKGLSQGTITDLDGKYSIGVKDKNAVLVFSFIGYDVQEQLVGNRTTIDIILKEKHSLLEEVVVIGYGTQKKKTLTGSVSVVDVGSLETRSKPSLAQSLAGKAAGLRVNQVSAQAGGGSRFRIRGEASIMAGNNPLIVIDGFPVSENETMQSGHIYSAGTTDNFLESLNPDDIESIVVLKDAASTAIYGARAGHGVILINTKRGEKEQRNISYSSNFSVQTIAKNYDLLNAKQYMDIRNKYAYEEYLQRYGMDIYQGYVAPPSGETPSFVAPFTEEQIRNAKTTSWMDEVARTGFLHQHNLSLSGGSETSRYLVSANYMDQKGVMKNNEAQRFTVRANLDKDIGKYITVGLTTTYSRNKYNNIPLDINGQYENVGLLTSAAQFNPTLPIYNEAGEYYIDPERSTTPNPVSMLEVTDVTKKDRLIGTAYAIIKPVRGLELKYQLGADRRFQTRSNYLPKTVLEGLRHNGEANIYKQDATDYLSEFTATYSHTVKDHHFKVLGGYSYQKFTGENANLGNSDFLIDGFLYHNIGAGEAPKPTVGSSAWNSSLASWFGRLNYEYKGRYLFEATFRSDGSSNFSPENRWGFFPSVAAGWLISEEAFMESARDWLSNLKLRFSYGETGNYNVGYHIQDFYGIKNPSYVLGGKLVAGVYTTDLGNPDLTWETTSELNVGVDLGFFKNRLSVSAEYFNREIRDLLSQESLMSYFEVSTIYGNIGKTQSKGYEFTINSVNIQNKDFGWYSTLTLSHYEDRWKERSPYWKPTPYQSVNDYIRSIWSYESLGILKPGEEAPPHQPNLLPGMTILKNQNPGDPLDENGEDTGNDYVLSEKDIIFKGTSDPNLTFGFNNTFYYKNFDLNIYFYGETGLTRGASYWEIWSQLEGTRNVTAYAFDAFRHDNQNTSRSTILSGNSWGDDYIRTIYYIRCGNIRLGYKIPVAGNIFKNIHAYVNVDNPFVITNWTGLDPETDNLTASYPNTRSYTIGININF